MPYEYHTPRRGSDITATFRNWLKKQPIEWINKMNAEAVIKKFKRQEKVPQPVDSLKLICVELIQQHKKKQVLHIERKRHHRRTFWY